LGGVIPTLPDSAINDQFLNPECEQGSEVVVVGSATTLPNGVSISVTLLVEIQCDLIALCE